MCGSILNGQTGGNAVVDAILNGYSPRTFNSVAVTDQQLDLVLKCGIKAPSARNMQPWRFTVIRDEATMKKLVGNIQPGNVLIVISGTEASPSGWSVDFDCALATHSMFVAAEGLGLGARILGGPVKSAIVMKDTLQVPSGFKPVAILRIGNVEKSVDAISSATTRKKFEEVVNYYK